MTKSLILAGGCFWCVEHDLKKIEGVFSVTSGYSGGESTNPTYESHKGHREVVKVEYDDRKISYKKILQFFLDHIDPTDDGGQFGDRGESYKTTIYYDDDSTLSFKNSKDNAKQEKKIAENVIEELNKSGVYEKKSVVQILPRKEFYKAEEYHQNYANKNPAHYNSYRKGSGREDFVNRTCKIRGDKNIPWKV